MARYGDDGARGLDEISFLCLCLNSWTKKVDETVIDLQSLARDILVEADAIVLLAAAVRSLMIWRTLRLAMVLSSLLLRVLK